MRRTDINNYPPAWLEVMLLESLAEDHPGFVYEYEFDGGEPEASFSWLPSGLRCDDECLIEITWGSNAATLSWTDFYDRDWHCDVSRETLSALQDAISEMRHRFAERTEIIRELPTIDVIFDNADEDQYHASPSRFQYTSAGLTLHWTSLIPRDEVVDGDYEIAWEIKFDNVLLDRLIFLIDHQSLLEQWRTINTMVVKEIALEHRPGRPDSELRALANAVIEDIEWALSEGEDFEAISGSSFSAFY